MNIAKIFLLFMIYSFIGWTIEVLCKGIESRKFINRGFLIGPYLPIYGCAGVIMTLTLGKYQDSIIALFVMSGSFSFVYYLSVLGISAVITGTVTGIISVVILDRIGRFYGDK